MKTRKLIKTMCTQDEYFFELDDKSNVFQYRAVETISCSLILFHFVIFDHFPPFFLGTEGGPGRGGPRFVYTRHVLTL